MPLILVPPYKLKGLSIVLAKIYSTWSTNELYGTLSNSNLTVLTSQSGLRGARSEVGVTSGKHYWEIFINDLNSFAMIGIASAVSHNAATPYQNPECVFCFSSSFYGGGSIVEGSNFSIATGMRIGIALDADLRRVSFYANGVFKAKLSFNIPVESKIYAVCCDGSAANGSTLTANFGATAFAYPVPSGFTSGLYAEGGDTWINVFFQAGSSGDTIANPNAVAQIGKDSYGARTGPFPLTIRAYSGIAPSGYPGRENISCMASEANAIIAAAQAVGPLMTANHTNTVSYSSYFAVLGVQKRFRMTRSGLMCTLYLEN